jgi:hypothetical protein
MRSAAPVAVTAVPRIVGNNPSRIDNHSSSCRLGVACLGWLLQAVIMQLTDCMVLPKSVCELIFNGLCNKLMIENQ